MIRVLFPFPSKFINITTPFIERLPANLCTFRTGPSRAEKKKEKQLLIPSSVHVLRKNRSHAFLMSGRGFVFLDDETPSSFHRRQSNITTLPSSSSPQYRPFPPSTTPRDGTLFPDRNFSKLIFISILEKTQLIELNPTQTHTAGWRWSLLFLPVVVAVFGV